MAELGMSVFDGGIVRVLVGATRQPFEVHAKAICCLSPFFDKPLKSSFAESNSREVCLVDTTPETFNILQQRVYCKRLPERDFETIARTWILANFLDMPKLQNQVMRYLATTTGSPNICSIWFCGSTTQMEGTSCEHPLCPDCAQDFKMAYSIAGNTYDGVKCPYCHTTPWPNFGSVAPEDENFKLTKSALTIIHDIATYIYENTSEHSPLRQTIADRCAWHWVRPQTFSSSLDPPAGFVLDFLNAMISKQSSGVKKQPWTENMQQYMVPEGFDLK